MGLAAIVKDFVTLVAASYSESPACNAVNEHVPTDTIVTVVDATVHTDVSAGVTVTVRPDVDDTVKEKAESPYVFADNDAKVMVCAAFDTVSVTSVVADRYAPPSTAVARITHVPTALNVTVGVELSAIAQLGAPAVCTEYWIVTPPSADAAGAKVTEPSVTSTEVFDGDHDKVCAPRGVVALPATTGTPLPFEFTARIRTV
jgi:hypothetical protein